MELFEYSFFKTFTSSCNDIFTRPKSTNLSRPRRFLLCGLANANDENKPSILAACGFIDKNNLANLDKYGALRDISCQNKYTSTTLLSQWWQKELQTTDIALVHS